MSELAQLPRCSHVPICGGCSRQQMGYADQLAEKQTVVEELFARKAHPIIPCQDPWEYRNKMEFSFSQDKKGESFLGLIMAKSRGHVFNLTECHLTSPWFAQALAATRQWWKESCLRAYHLYKDEGALRTLTVREGKRTGDKLVMLTVSGNPLFSLTKEQLDGFVAAIKQTVADPSRLSIFLRIQQIAKKTPTQFFEMHLFGPDHITETLTLDLGTRKHTLSFKISPTSFFQPYSAQAEVLYSRALQMAHLTPDSHVLDLYSGTATLSMAFALKAKQVTAIELNPHAVFDAKANCEHNQIGNVTLHCGDVGEVLKTLPLAPAPDLVVVDPPRAGLDPKALEHLLALAPPQILYISCNPKTQAENVQFLETHGHTLRELQPVDQFPHTKHIENIALLTR